MTNLWLKLLLDEIPPISLLHHKWISFETETAKLAIKIAMDSLHPLFGTAAKANGTKRKKKSVKERVVRRPFIYFTRSYSKVQLQET